ncbi:hypothetical protein G6F50_017476 [Rhizopus delemar]|uniref:Uncharacterized protein n=1 Tax=Rhizopus delemar TaxID=936053 RepID=A0A9P6XQX7_9FUNG|nr:hypothetical protein G6F50_017476 [Rhizopus delemar]
MKSGDTSPDSISAGTPNAESRLADGNAIDDGARGRPDHREAEGLCHRDRYRSGARALHHPDPARSLPGRDRAGAPAGA